jgi:hypothetical protein
MTAVHIENCAVTGFGSDGIVQGATNSSLFIEDTIVRKSCS